MMELNHMILRLKGKLISIQINFGWVCLVPKSDWEVRLFEDMEHTNN